MHRSTAFIAFLVFMTSFAFAQTNDISIIRQRVIAELFSNPVADNQVETVVAKMKEDGSFPGIDYADLSNIAGFPQQRHLSDLL